jgi:DNA polymerase-3 subunit delta'
MQFKDIKGQTITANHLTEIIDSGRVSHTQMFLGETASGSLALAIAYAQYLNCEHRQHYGETGRDGLRADSCGQCPSCKKYQQLSHSDLHLYFPSAATASVKGSNISSADFQGEFRQFLDAKHQIGTLDEWYEFMQIENKQGMIRERDADDMVRTLGMKSYEGGSKVVIIWMAEKMNLQTSNKILKSLEEPTPGTLIILVAENSDKMLSTILSRTQIVKIHSTRDVARTANDEFRSLYVAWMRQLFKLNMASLSAWVDTMHSKSREVQKQFLIFAQEAVRDAFLRNNAGLPSHIDFGDEKFNNSFPAMITERNIESLNDAFNNALFAIERNAYGKIAFMELSFCISKALKKR